MRFCIAIFISLAGWLAAGSEALAAPDSSTNAAPAKRSQVRSLWAVRPVTAVAPPRRVAGTNYVSPIDAFLQAKLDEKHLTPNPPADRRTLIRRLYYDLHGLPPTPEAVADFAADPAPAAYEHLVDRLLASPRYGERWGRHWLDVVHYGETHGYDKDTRRLNAWPYRDYVIRAFNEDKPYGRFVREQLAGDVLYPTSPDGIVATGFIVAGPWDRVAQTELKEGTMDKQITRLLDRDDMVANTMTTFCSLTVHCARCHDHKFDPITQKDYYALQSVFAGVDRAERYYDPDAAVLNRRLTLLGEQRTNSQELAVLATERARVASARIRALDAEIRSLGEQIVAAAQLSNAVPGYGKGYHAAVAPAPLDAKWVQVDLGKSYSLDEIALVPVHLKLGDFPGPGFGFPRRFRIEMAEDAEFTQPTLVADETKADYPNPGDAPYLARKAGVRGRYVRVTATKLARRDAKKNDWIFALSELIALSDGRDVALGGVVTSLDSVDSAPTWAKTNLVDGRSSWGVLFNPSPTDGYQSATAAKADTVKWVQVDLGRVRPVEQVRLVPARSRETPETAGFGFPVHFRLEAAVEPTFLHPVLIADRTGADYEPPELEPQTFAATNVQARYVRLTATQLWRQKEDRHVLALAEMEVLDDHRLNVARGAKVSALDSVESARWGAQFLVDGFSSLTALPEEVPVEVTVGYRSATAAQADTTKWVQVDLGRKMPMDVIRLAPAFAAGKTNAFGFPVRFRLEVANDPEFQTDPAVLFETPGDFLTSAVSAAGFALLVDAVPARYVRLTATRLDGVDGEFALALAEMEVVSEGWNVARGAPVQASDSVELPGWSVRYLVDGRDQNGPRDNTADVMEALHRQAEWEERGRAARRRREAEITALMDDDSNRLYARVGGRAEELEARLGELPRQQAVFAAANDFPASGTFTPAADPRPIHLLERGDVARPGDLVSPAPPACITNVAGEFVVKDAAQEGERRAALARWISAPANAITWRSIVNRVWSYHFGRGIVDSPNDFGNMGSAPTHPELLDWLAAEFLAHGESLKWLHRQILLSAAYQQSSVAREDYARLDSGNQYLWRMNRDRLDAEALRDSLLRLAGRLDLTMGGPGFDLFAFKDDYSPHYEYEKYDPEDAKTWRRSVYRSIVRSVPDPMQEALDCADPSQSVPVRNTTLTALQALTLMNNPFSVRMAEQFAARLELLAGRPGEQIEWAFRLAFGREPTAAEAREFGEHARRFGLANTCRLLLNSNEFNFVD